MKIKSLSTVLIFTASYLACSAKETKPDCSGSGSTYESLACANAVHDSLDKKLNLVFKEMKSGMSKSQVTLLVAAQKGWLQLRDNQCKLESFADQGTGANQRFIECLSKLTQGRIRQLEQTPTDSVPEP